MDTLRTLAVATDGRAIVTATTSPRHEAGVTGRQRVTTCSATTRRRTPTDGKFHDIKTA